MQSDSTTLRPAGTKLLVIQQRCLCYCNASTSYSTIPVIGMFSITKRLAASVVFAAPLLPPRALRGRVFGYYATLFFPHIHAQP